MSLSVLLISVKKDEQIYNQLILSTPTGDIRNRLTDVNIALANLRISIEDQIEQDDLYKDEGKATDRYHR
jgi:hypothetical protein